MRAKTPNTHRTIWPSHCFFWDTHLTDERMEEIDKWLQSLSDEQRSMFEDLMEDARRDWDYEIHFEW